ncbi:MAG TPA: hypothetical protein VMD91_04325 [Candidatus Sulfotelmatobacter sp.]|nr:hypothetical protein [Candidatus Sulfotelmatobacter sp.]
MRSGTSPTALALTLAVLLGSATVARAADTTPAATTSGAAVQTTLTDPDAIFLAARKERTSSGYPRYASYTAVVRYRDGNVPVIRSWDTVEDLQKRLVFTHGISREEQAHPPTPTGINIGIAGGSSGVQNVPAPTKGGGNILGTGLTMNAATSADVLGQVTFAINQDFGISLNAPPVSQTQDLVDISTTKPYLPHIGSTAVIARTYTVVNLGNVTEGNVHLYHLGLTPLRDPNRYRLRELWIDMKTFDVVRAKVSGIGNGLPFSATPWLVEFRQWEGGSYIDRETALGPMQDSGDTCYDTTITFEEVSAHNELTPYEQVGITETTGIADP